MAEISDAALAEYQQAHALLKALHDDSAVSVDFQKLVKRKFPNASTPTLDIVNRANEEAEALKKKADELGGGLSKKIDDFLAAQAKKEEDASVEAFSTQIERIVKDRGYTEDGRKAFLEMMKERSIQNPEDAAVIFESRQPKPAAQPRQFSSRMNFVSPDGKDDESFKRLMDDPDQWMGDELTAAIEETRVANEE